MNDTRKLGEIIGLKFDQNEDGDDLYYSPSRPYSWTLDSDMLLKFILDQGWQLDEMSSVANGLRVEISHVGKGQVRVAYGDTMFDVLSTVIREFVAPAESTFPPVGDDALRDSLPRRGRIIRARSRWPVGGRGTRSAERIA